MDKLKWAILILLGTCSVGHAVVNLDVDKNGATDINKGGTNATTAANARTALGVPSIASTLVGDCTVGPCLDGSSDGGNIIKLWAGTGSYWTALQGGAPEANRSWRLPIAAPPSAGNTYLMNMDEYGQMGFISPSTYLTPSGSGAALTVDASGFDGNLATTDNTLQEIAQKLDDLTAGGGGYTNLTSFIAQTAWRIFYSDGAGDVKELALGADGEYLRSNGASSIPSWSTPTGGAHDAVTLGTDADTVFGLSTQQLTLDSQTANYFFAAPNGSAGDPTFRAIVAADIPTLNQSTTGNASTATALASNPLDCSTGQYATAIAANGNLTCSSVAYTDVSGTPSTEELSATTLATITGLTGNSKYWGTNGSGAVGVYDLPSSSSNPPSADGAALGSASLEWSDLYIASGGVIYGENDQSNAMTSSSTGFNFNLPIGLPSSNDPDVAAEGKIAWDANGDVLRGYDGTRQVAVARVQKEIQVTVIKPNDLDDAQRDAFLVWSNNSGMSFVVTGWYAWSTSDDTDLNIEETDGDGANNATVDAVSITTNGTGIYYANDSTITAGTIENGHLLWLDFDDTDAPNQVHVTIYGYFNADVN